MIMEKNKDVSEKVSLADSLVKAAGFHKETIEPLLAGKITSCGRYEFSIIPRFESLEFVSKDVVTGETSVAVSSLDGEQTQGFSDPAFDSLFYGIA